MAEFDLPSIVLYTVPIPSLILLILIGLYHLTPLLTLLPNVHLSPLLNSLATAMPKPKRNLPREFFNLPPRPSSPSTQATLEKLRVLSLRGKVILLLSGHAVVGLSLGWAFLASGKGWPLAAVASTGLLSAVTCLTIFTAYQTPSSSRLMCGGGVTHSTIFSRIFPLSTIAPVLTACISAAGSSIAPFAILAVSSLMVAITLTCSLVGGYRMYVKPRAGPIRLASPETEEQDVSGVNDESWLTEPSQPNETSHVSAFSFSPTPSLKTLKTPKARTKSRSTNTNGTPNSWLSSPTDTPQTLPSWQQTPQIASPQVALTRQRSSSPVPPESLPRPIQPTPARQYKSSTATTAGDRTMMTSTSITSPGGSILGGYEPSPSQPLPPRGFASLTSFPMSPEELEVVGGSRVSVATRYGYSRSGEAISFIPEEREQQDVQDPRASAWTLETYYSASDVPFTPARTGSTTPGTGMRAPPPPPMPCGMPLPPTPTAARSETAVEWGPHAKESREWLMGERDWVEVDGDVDAMDDWSKEGRGVGFVAIVGVLICYGLSIPMFINGLSSLSGVLYLIAIILPAPMIALASYLLRYRPTPTTRDRIKKSSLKSISTHRSLALQSASELSLPISMSPKLTPPNEKRILQPNAGLAHKLDPKPSVSNFGYNRHLRPTTIYGLTDAREQMHWRERLEDARATKNMHRRSTSIWLEGGLARATPNRWSRTAEMLKPSPALCIMDGQNPRDGVLKRLRGGVVSMLPKRVSGVPEDYPLDHLRSVLGEDPDPVPPSPIAISITSPSKWDRRRASGLSEVMAQDGDGDGDGDGEGDGDEMEGEGATTMQSAEIQVATKGRMSVSPIVFCGRPGSTAIVRGEDGYDLDWMTAGVLPNLVPNLKIGSNVKVAPGPAELAHRRASQPTISTTHRHAHQSHAANDSIGAVSNFRGSIDMATPSRHGHGQGHRRGPSSSVDYSSSPDFHGALASTPHASAGGGSSSDLRRRVLRHKASFSLPNIDPADFADVRRSFDDCGRTPQKPAQHSHSLIQNQDIDQSGIDPPPIPSVYAYSRRDLSRLTERDEANESSLMRETMADMRSAILALSSPANSHLADTSVASSRMDLADLAPIILHGDTLNASTSSYASGGTDEELMAEEMERVMAMDTPTRAEFVISPPMSSYAGSTRDPSGRDSRASNRTSRTRMSVVDAEADDEGVPALPNRYAWTATPTTATTTTSGDADTTTDQFTDADEYGYGPLPSTARTASNITLDIPELREYKALQHAASMPSMFAHPHPAPPGQGTATGPLSPRQSVPNFSRPGGMTSHPPIPIKEQQALRGRKSTETIASDYTGASMGTPSPRVGARPVSMAGEEFRLSKGELTRLQALKERKDVAAGMVAGGRSHSAMGLYELSQKEKKEKEEKETESGKVAGTGTKALPTSALRPLQLVERNSNRISQLPQPQPQQRKDRSSVYADKPVASDAGAKNQGATLAERRGKGSKMSSISTGTTGSGKENVENANGGERVRVGKGSNGGYKSSTGSGVRVLRA